MKTHQSAMDAFLEFECRFAQLTGLDQRLVGVDKVLLFVKSIDRRERNAIGILLEDDDGANGLTENWAEVERVCRRHDKRKMRILSTNSQPMKDDKKEFRCGNALPPKEESLKMEGSTVLDIKALIREAYENLKVQVDAEEKLEMESKLRQIVIKEEETSQQMHTNDAANAKAQVKYDDIVGESVEEATFSSSGETTTKDETNDSRMVNATSRENECLRTCIVFETSSDEGASMSNACFIKGDKKCETDMIEEIATENDIESEMAMDESTADGHVETFLTPDLETSAVAPLCQRETGETEGGGGKTKAHHEEEEDRGRKDFPTPILETSAVAPLCQRETGETEGGGGKIKVQHDEEVKIEADVYDEDICIVNTFLIEKVNRYETHEFEEVVMDDTTKAIGQRHMEYSMLVLETWAVATESQHETQETEGADKGKVIVTVHDKNGEQSTTKDDQGQAGQEYLKSAPWNDISTSNNKDNNIKIVISNVRLYDKGGRSGKYAIWSVKDLKKGLLWEIDIGVRTGLFKGKYGKRNDEGWKCVDQGDGRNEGGTCVVHKEIYSMDVVEPTPSGRGERYEPWLWWKEWSWWHWRKKDKEPTSRFQVNLHHT